MQPVLLFLGLVVKSLQVPPLPSSWLPSLRNGAGVEEENGQAEEVGVVDTEVTVVIEEAEILTVAEETDLLDEDHALGLQTTEEADKKTAIGRATNVTTATSLGELNVTDARHPDPVVEVVVVMEVTEEAMIEEDMTGGTETGVMTDGTIAEEIGGTTGVVEMTGGVVMEDAVVVEVAAMCGTVIGHVPNVASTTLPVGQSASNAMPRNKWRSVFVMPSNEQIAPMIKPSHTTAVSGPLTGMVKFIWMCYQYTYCFYKPGYVSCDCRSNLVQNFGRRKPFSAVCEVWLLCKTHLLLSYLVLSFIPEDLQYFRLLPSSYNFP